MLRNDSQCLAKSSSPQTNEKAPSMTEVFSININNNSKLAGLTGGKFPPALCTSPQKSTFGLNEVLYNNCLDRWSSASDCSFFFFFPSFFKIPAIFCNRISQIFLFCSNALVLYSQNTSRFL